MDGVILSSAFELRKKNKELDRPKDEKTLSVDWYEYYDKDNYKKIVSALINRKLTVKNAGMLTKLNVGNVRKKILRQLKLKIYIDNLGPDSHSSLCGLYGYDSAALILVNLIDEKIAISDCGAGRKHEKNNRGTTAHPAAGEGPAIRGGKFSAGLCGLADRHSE
jgi:hypothetical protein